MREQFNNVCVTLLLVAEILLALLIGYRMVNSIGWDGHNYTYQTSDSDYLLTTEYDVHWQKGNVTYKGIPEFKDAVELFIRDGII